MKRCIFIDEEHATLRSFNAANSRAAGVTLLKLELEIASPYALAEILRQCAEFKAPPPRAKKGTPDDA